MQVQHPSTADSRIISKVRSHSPHLANEARYMVCRTLVQDLCGNLLSRSSDYRGYAWLLGSCMINGPWDAISWLLSTWRQLVHLRTDQHLFRLLEGVQLMMAGRRTSVKFVRSSFLPLPPGGVFSPVVDDVSQGFTRSHSAFALNVSPVSTLRPTTDTSLDRRSLDGLAAHVEAELVSHRCKDIKSAWISHIWISVMPSESLTT